MDNQLSKSSHGSRPGVAKDQLIFIIICSVALAVAAVTLVHFFTGSKKVPASQWQCLECGKEFTLKKAFTPPVKCTKCGGEAVRLGYRTCEKCGEKVLAYRIRMSGQAQAPGGPGGPPGMGPMQPMDMQFRIQQADGSYDWTPWMSSASPQVQQMYANLTCPKCGESLSVMGRSSR